MWLLAWLLSLTVCQAVRDKPGPTLTERPDLSGAVVNDSGEPGLVNYTGVSDEGGELVVMEMLRK